MREYERISFSYNKNLSICKRWSGIVLAPRANAPLLGTKQRGLQRKTMWVCMELLLRLETSPFSISHLSLDLLLYGLLLFQQRDIRRIWKEQCHIKFFYIRVKTTHPDTTSEFSSHGRFEGNQIRSYSLFIILFTSFQNLLKV